MRPADDVLARSEARPQDRLGEAVAAEAAVRHDAEAPQPEQVGAADALPGRSPRAARRATLSAAGRRALPRAEDVAASRIARSSTCEVPSSTFSAMLPVRPSVTTMSARPVTRSPPSTLPTNSNGSADEAGALAQLAPGLDDQRAAARVLLAVGEQPHARARHAEHDARQRGAHERELDEVLAPRLGARAHVEQRHRVARHGQRHRQRGPVDAAVALDVERARGDRRARSRPRTPAPVRAPPPRPWSRARSRRRSSRGRPRPGPRPWRSRRERPRSRRPAAPRPARRRARRAARALPARRRARRPRRPRPDPGRRRCSRRRRPAQP